MQKKNWKIKTKEPEHPKNQKNYVAYVARNTMAIQKNLNTHLRVPVLQRACELLYRFDEYLQEQAINEWVEKFGLSKKLLMGFLKGESKPELSPVDELREYLLTFDIRQNEITKEISIKKNKKPMTLDELKITLETEGYKDLKHFDKLIDTSNKNVTVTKLFNPLHDFFLSLAERFKGENLIGELVDCIPAMEFGDKTDGFYQKRMEYYLKKWLYKAAGQGLSIDINDAMLLWLEGEGGSGKSRIIQWLFSLPEFEKYRLKIGANDSYMPINKISSSFFLLDFDELPLGQKKYQEFKSTITSTYLQDYTKSSKGYETFIRRVNFIGSSNKVNRGKQPGYLIDDDDAMKRRIIPIELFGRIDYLKYLKDIDLYQLWGQAAAGILQAQKSNNKELLTWECDWADLREQNSRYVNSTETKNIDSVLRYFKPTEIEKGRLLSASEMIIELEQKGIKILSNAIEIGMLLAAKGYNKGKRINKRGFWVK